MDAGSITAQIYLIIPINTNLILKLLAIKNSKVCLCYVITT